MKLHTVIITHNRLELTKQAVESYLETVTLPHTLVVVDNASTDGTREWLLNDFDYGIHLLNENRYPGFACNLGFSMAPLDATHLHRADNDFAFLDDWDKEVERMFSDERLGQLGLRTDEEELFAAFNIGGNCLLRRELWDKGLRWDERSWPQLREEIGPGHTEDSLMSPAVKEMGYYWNRVERPCIQPIGYESPEDDYYRQAWADRGIVPA